MPLSCVLRVVFASLAFKFLSYYLNARLAKISQRAQKTLTNQTLGQSHKNKVFLIDFLPLFFSNEGFYNQKIF